jgi:uncharacterized protein YgbK (DUF1537 family)
LIPGPFTRSYLNEKYGSSTVEQGKKVFLSIGSVSKTTIGQIEHLLVSRNPDFVKVDPLKLIDDNQVDKEIDRVISIIREKLEANKSNILGVSTTTREERSSRLNSFIRRIKDR